MRISHRNLRRKKPNQKILLSTTMEFYDAVRSQLAAFLPPALEKEYIDQIRAVMEKHAKQKFDYDAYTKVKKEMQLWIGKKIRNQD